MRRYFIRRGIQRCAAARSLGGSYLDRCVRFILDIKRHRLLLIRRHRTQHISETTNATDLSLLFERAESISRRKTRLL